MNLGKISVTLVQLVVFGILFNGCEILNPEKKNNDALTAYYLLYLLRSYQSSTTSTASCPTNPSTVTHAQLAAATSQATTNCKSCHSGSTINAGFDITSFPGVTSRVVVNNANTSLLFQKIYGGSMAGYSGSTFRNTILDFICSGATP